MGGFIMNSRRNFIKQSVLAGSALALGIGPTKLLASEDLVRLTVLHTNDMHCHIDPFPEDHAEFPGKGGLTRVATMVTEIRKENPNVVLFDGGDLFQGTPYFNYFKGDLMVQVMNKIGYDAGTIGNHEFDNGLPDILSAVKHAGFPLISSNYDFSDTILDGFVKKYHVIKKSGLRIGIYGLGIELQGLVGKQNFGNTKYLDPLKVALEMEKLLKNDCRCDLVVCLSHLGYSYEHSKISDLTLAPQTRYTDLIVGGHTHTFLPKPTIVQNAANKSIVVNQAGWAALNLGRIDFAFDKAGKVKEPIIVLAE